MLVPEVCYLPEDDEADASGVRRSKRRGRWATKAAVGVALAGLVGLGAVGGAYAAGGFSDVPSDHPFKGAIDWMAYHNVSEGYPDGTFRPTAPVTRQAMSSFLRAYNFETSMVVASGSAASSTVLEITATCPAGKSPIGGGGTVAQGNVYITDSNPTSTGWRIRWETKNNTAVALLGSAWVTCKPNNQTG